MRVKSNILRVSYVFLFSFFVQGSREDADGGEYNKK